jgi:hypothetical protein
MNTRETKKSGLKENMLNLLRLVLGLLNAVFNRVLPRPNTDNLLSSIPETAELEAAEARAATLAKFVAAGGEALPKATATAVAEPEVEARLAETEELKPGWVLLPPEELPQPTYWPVVMALAIVLIAFGAVTTLLIAGAGLVMFAIALGGWIGDLEQQQTEAASSDE